MPHLVEVYIAGCKLCEKTIEIIKELVCPECEIKIYNVVENPEYLEKTSIQIKAVPTIIIDGKHVITGLPDKEDLKQYLKP